VFLRGIYLILDVCIVVDIYAWRAVYSVFLSGIDVGIGRNVFLPGIGVCKFSDRVE